MKLKLKLVVAAMAFAVTGQAFAAIAPGSTGNGELFMSVYDGVAQTSYVRDLGVDMNTFIANGSNAGYSLNYAADSLLTSTFNLATNTNLLWNVAALDTTVTPGVTYLGQRYLSTTNSPTSQFIGVQSNSNLAGFSTVDGYVNAINLSDGTNDPTNTALNVSSVHSGSGNSAYFGNNFKNNWNSSAKFDSTAAVGTSLSFFSLTPSSSSGLGKATITQFGNANGNASWTLASNGTLSYSVPAPAAVPLPAAVWLLGSGLIGMVGVARRKSTKSAA